MMPDPADPAHWRLVKLRSVWAVCWQEIVIDDDEQQHCWVFGQPAVKLCLVGSEDYSWPLPYPEKTNFFSDRFHFAIDRRFSWSDRWEKCGGADNAAAANGAFKTFVENGKQNEVFRVRDGSRIMRKETGTQA
ncbi:hypothetical protein [Rhizobium wenxiniae]|uniref:hypothetical protein n=1 Tax=Rhizobium wenxiniae TaxID=1737357 RepID=UPI003C1EC2E3